MEKTFEELKEAVVSWASARGIVPNADPKTQLLKAVSELGETCDAEIKDDLGGVVDGVGDTLVCLINYCAIRNLNIVVCLDMAYNEIKDRKGKTTGNGTFIKD
jgi:hypothetical protein